MKNDVMNEGFTAGLKKAQGAIARVIMESLAEETASGAEWLDEDATTPCELETNGTSANDIRSCFDKTERYT